MLCQCENCGVELQKRVYQIRSRSRLVNVEYKPKKFCSHKCQWSYLRRKQKGTAHPLWKNILLKCPECGLLFHPQFVRKGRKHQFCSKRCYVTWERKAYQGKNNPFFGRQHSASTIRILREINRVNSKLLWRDIEYRTKVVRNTLKALMKKPTKPEQQMIEICEKHKIPLKYVGDGSRIIMGLNPDFLCEERRKIVEVFGDYWHRASVRSIHRPKPRKAIFRRAGYETLILWEHELTSLPADVIVEKVRVFLA